jgi:hypothetical protein
MSRNAPSEGLRETLRLFLMFDRVVLIPAKPVVSSVLGWSASAARDALGLRGLTMVVLHVVLMTRSLLLDGASLAPGWAVSCVHHAGARRAARGPRGDSTLTKGHV